ncbi:hypothetical protein [Paracoccus jeotgali]|uniref:hypothetical protein n=1 Tax=Paracoccus jeotgali TaxID=2065379 RepID=UPI0028AF9C5B|nr:hypothetical protein [Paracoccus jeotgali]
MTDRTWAWLVLILAVAFAVSPLFSDGFNGFTKDQFPVVLDHWPAQPAGWAFSIWGVIYLWLIIGLGYGVWRRADDPDWQPARPALALSLAVGVPWIAVANMAPIATTVMILIMAAAAIAAMLRAGRHDPLLQAQPIGLYAGWLTAASGVALAVTLSGHAVLSPQPAALILLALVLAVALIMQARRPDVWSYPLAVGWAALGIVAANFRADYWPVAALAALGIVALAWRYFSGKDMT